MSLLVCVAVEAIISMIRPSSGYHLPSLPHCHHSPVWRGEDPSPSHHLSVATRLIRPSGSFPGLSECWWSSPEVVKTGGLCDPHLTSGILIGVQHVNCDSLYQLISPFTSNHWGIQDLYNLYKKDGLIAILSLVVQQCSIRSRLRYDILYPDDYLHGQANRFAEAWTELILFMCEPWTPDITTKYLYYTINSSNDLPSYPFVVMKK